MFLVDGNCKEQRCEIPKTNTSEAILVVCCKKSSKLEMYIRSVGIG